MTVVLSTFGFSNTEYTGFSASFTEKGSDCQRGDGASYRGTVSVTATGNTCQRWDSQTPQAHYGFNTPEDNPSSGLEQNYCRNPDGESGVWCYDADNSTRWEYCDVPVCDLDSGCYNLASWTGAATGTISSMYYGTNSNYEDNASCKWEITVTSGKYVTLTFHRTFRVDPFCLGGDKVTVYSGVTNGLTELGSFCGTTTPSTVQSCSNKMTVEFTTDSANAYRGFLASFSESDTACAVVTTSMTSTAGRTSAAATTTSSATTHPVTTPVRTVPTTTPTPLSTPRTTTSTTTAPPPSTSRTTPSTTTTAPPPSTARTTPSTTTTAPPPSTARTTTTTTQRTTKSTTTTTTTTPSSTSRASTFTASNVSPSHPATTATTTTTQRATTPTSNGPAVYTSTTTSAPVTTSGGGAHVTTATTNRAPVASTGPVVTTPPPTPSATTRDQTASSASAASANTTATAVLVTATTGSAKAPGRPVVQPWVIGTVVGTGMVAIVTVTMVIFCCCCLKKDDNRVRGLYV
ncbi:uncharacterized protein [Branchiostoma lanceolatum]